MEDLNLPEIKRKKIEEKKAEDKKEFKGLFQSDSDSDEDDDAGLKIKCELTPSCLVSPTYLNPALQRMQFVDWCRLWCISQLGL